ncbi:MAG: type II toxin-antitoxin system HicA family toxin [Bacteroidales bacterium]|nr:type II toxin-antitoxin system HicA family toxin [Bacteroidales bacterium]MBR5735687.1 type II toxin-antitoxin system HicA family toxin [Bacteroidales bacterium]
MTWNEFRKMIIQKGWVLVRHGGDHDIYKKTGRSDSIVVERHWNEEIKRGLQKRLLKKVNNDN